MAQGTTHPPAGEVYGSLLLLAAQQAVRLAADANALGGTSPGWAIGCVAEAVADPRADEVSGPYWREIILVVGGARSLWCSSPHYRAWLGVLRAAEGRIGQVPERKAVG